MKRFIRNRVIQRQGTALRGRPSNGAAPCGTKSGGRRIFVHGFPSVRYLSPTRAARRDFRARSAPVTYDDPPRANLRTNQALSGARTHLRSRGPIGTRLGLDWDSLWTLFLGPRRAPSSARVRAQAPRAFELAPTRRRPNRALRRANIFSRVAHTGVPHRASGCLL
jgi:hypothetical protein